MKRFATTQLKRSDAGRAVPRALVIAVLLGASASVAVADDELTSRLRNFRAGPVRELAESVALSAGSSLPTVAVVATTGNSYAAWAAEVFSPEELAHPNLSAPDAVRAADGLTNLMKYALGLDPHVVAAPDALPETGQLDEHWFYWYRRPSDTDDVEYRVEASTDGGENWSSAGVTQEPILVNDLAESWQAHYHAAEGCTVWFRLVVKLR